MIQLSRIVTLHTGITKKTKKSMPNPNDRMDLIERLLFRYWIV